MYMYMYMYIHIDIPTCVLRFCSCFMTTRSLSAEVVSIAVVTKTPVMTCAARSVTVFTGGDVHQKLGGLKPGKLGFY